MNEMTSRERFIKAIKGEPADKIPFCDYIDSAMEQQLRKHYGFGETGYDFWKFIGVDAVEFCEYYAPLFVGDAKTKTLKTLSGLHSEDGADGFAEDGLIWDWEDLELMQFPDLTEPGFYDFAQEYIDNCKEEGLASCFALRAFPVHCAIYSMGIENFSYALADDEDLIKEVMRRYNEWNIQLIKDLEARGMDCIIVCNDMAFNSGTFMRPDVYKELFHPYVKEVADSITVPWAFHSDGDLSGIFDDILEITKCINPIDPNCMDIYKVREQYGDKVVPWGNVDVNLLSNGTVDEVKNTVRKLLTEIGSTGGYIFGSGNSIPYYTKLENVVAMIETYKEVVGK